MGEQKAACRGSSGRRRACLRLKFQTNLHMVDLFLIMHRTDQGGCTFTRNVKGMQLWKWIVIKQHPSSQVRPLHQLWVNFPPFIIKTQHYGRLWYGLRTRPASPFCSIGPKSTLFGNLYVVGSPGLPSGTNSKILCSFCIRQRLLKRS